MSFVQEQQAVHGDGSVDATCSPSNLPIGAGQQAGAKHGDCGHEHRRLGGVRKIGPRFCIPQTAA